MDNIEHRSKSGFLMSLEEFKNSFQLPHACQKSPRVKVQQLCRHLYNYTRSSSTNITTKSIQVSALAPSPSVPTIAPASAPAPAPSVPTIAPASTPAPASSVPTIAPASAPAPAPSVPITAPAPTPASTPSAGADVEESRIRTHQLTQRPSPFSPRRFPNFPLPSLSHALSFSPFSRNTSLHVSAELSAVI
ncbi:hypothetical protein FHG87_016710 [Trinorchestia longiramus]|nr:hypothetical protein FHG87_016710 [Trinorchestia longiramus]